MNASASDASFAHDPDAQPRSEAREFPRTDLGLRVLYSLVFAVILHLAAGILTVLVLVQLVMALVTSRSPHERLSQFGTELTRYCASVARYLTFSEPTPPFPFSDLPESPPKA